jgi:hypothetical protein
MIDKTQKPECDEFRRVLGGRLDIDPAREAQVEAHAAACPECAGFRANLSSVDRIGHMVSKVRFAPSLEARERLHASWQHLAVRTSWRDWVKYWFAYELEPKVFRPLMPHAAMITGFIFFSLSLIQIQVNTGWLTPRPVAERHFQIAEIEAADPPLRIASLKCEVLWHKSGKVRIDTV